MTVTVGFCGAGRVSRLHADGFRRAGATILGFADPVAASAQAMADSYGGRAFSSLTDLLQRAAPDVVCIATPHDLHAAQAAEALNAGSDVFLDKPIALSPADGQALVDLAARCGRRLGVNLNLLFHPAVTIARDLLANGAIGRPISAAGWSNGWLDLAPHDFRLSRERTGGGAWADAGPHLVYTLGDLLGPIDRLVAFPAAPPSRLGGEDSLVAAMTFASGAVASLRISYAYRAPRSDLPWPAGWRQGFEINGTTGSLRLVVSPVGRVDLFGEADDRWIEAAADLPFSESFDGAIASFLAGSDSAAPQDGSATQAVALLAQMQAALPPSWQ
jgi:predicted dehydrogenase